MSLENIPTRRADVRFQGQLGYRESLSAGPQAREPLQRQRLLDREEIPPRQPLLQRAAQQECRMKGGECADFARPGVVGKPASARAGNAFLDAEQRLRRGPAEANQDV